MSHPKVVIVGAGSLFFGRKSIWQMVHSPWLRDGTLALVDTDAVRLDRMRRLAEMVITRNDAPLKLEASTDRCDVLAGADFVVLSFAHRNAYYRGVDCQTSERYGVRMCSGDTIGPGGVFRSLREWPEIAGVAEDVLDLCPDARVVNYINPTAVHGIGLRRFYPQIKSFAICDAQYKLRPRFAGLAGVPTDDKLRVLTAGPNHFTWLLEASYDGRDLVPTIVAQVRAAADRDFNTQAQGAATNAKGWLNNSIAIELYEALGVLPTVLGHTKEYVPFYQRAGLAGRDRHPPLKVFEVPDRMRWTEEVWQRVDDYVEGRVGIAEFNTEFGPDPATDMIEAILDGKGRRFFANTMNGGAVPNMADDAFLELYCTMGPDGPVPLSHPPMPRGVRGRCEQILDTHELTAEAAQRQDRTLARRALLTDPLTMSIGDADAILDELFDAQAEVLEGYEQGSAVPV